MLVLGINLFILHRSPNELDIAPFQIDPLGVQGERLHRTELAVDKNLFSGYYLRDASELSLGLLQLHIGPRGLRPGVL